MSFMDPFFIGMALSERTKVGIDAGGEVYG
ncbi:hypothetical protein HmCmsJML036_00236 [Escherichia coli]|nr:hypothetical protein HmCmsJML036_00236 [Escherichia coli]